MLEHLLKVDHVNLFQLNKQMALGALMKIRKAILCLVDTAEGEHLARKVSTPSYQLYTLILLHLEDKKTKNVRNLNEK